MKALYESVSNLSASSFIVRQFEEKYFSAPYHFHPELELTYIIKGAGKRYVGDRMDDYTAGDLVLLGENLPHCWKTESIDTDNINAISIVVHFSRDFLGENFFTIPEMKRIDELLKMSRNGISFNNAIGIKVGEMMYALLWEQSAVKKIGRLLEILENLALTNDYTILETQNLYEEMASIEREKINKITAYVVDHFKDPVTVEEVSALVYMSPHAFCKYFKKITRKTFMEIVIDYRINFAAQQLIYTDLPVSQIAFGCGFSDLSNFYRTFKKRKKLSPLAYRKFFLQ